jgi:hypothetical protein
MTIEQISMVYKPKNNKYAKSVALLDMTEEERSYLYYEKDLLIFISGKVPDFRIFNGGYHPKKK